MGKVDQGVFTLLAAAPPLRQAAQLHRLRRRRATRCATCSTSTTWSSWSTSSSPTPSAGTASSATSAAGARSASRCCETTEICRELTGNEVAIEPAGEGRPGDVPLYISDCSRLFGRTDWRPRQGGQRGTRRHLGLGRTEHEDDVASVAGAARMKLSVVIPAHNEAGSIAETLTATIDALDAARDRARDPRHRRRQHRRHRRRSSRRSPPTHPQVRCLRSHHPRGFGFAVRAGLERFERRRGRDR